jgi:hypothetical protein
MPACLLAYRPDRVLNLDAQESCYPLSLLQYLEHSTITLVLNWAEHVRLCHVHESSTVY